MMNSVMDGMGIGPLLIVHLVFLALVALGMYLLFR